jgi:hypothetical protein
MKRYLLCLILLWTIAGCGRDQAEQAQGIWSNGEQGRLIDVSPNGFYADVWLDSEALVSAWEIREKNELSLMPLCSALPEGEQLLPFQFLDDGLTFPGENGRYSRYAREPRQEPVDPRLVGLWQRESRTRKKEFMEFTPWSTVIWNRWVGEPGSEKLIAGWANAIRSPDGDILFRGVEDRALLAWNDPVRYQVLGTKLTLHLPGDLGQQEFTKASRTELLQATKAQTR